MEELRTPLQKIAILALAAMILVFGVLTAVVRSRPGVAFRDELLRVSREGETTLYTGKIYYDEVTIAVYPDGGGTAVDFRAQEGPTWLCRVDWPGGTLAGEGGMTFDAIRISRNGEVLFEGGYSGEHQLWCRPDGSLYMPVAFEVRTSGGSPWDGFDFDEGRILRFALGPELSVRGSWGAWGVMSAVSVLLMLVIAFPITLFRWRYSAAVRDPEPSEFYLAACRVECVLLPVMMLLSYIWSLTLIE